MTTTVVHVRSAKCDVYVGRANARYGLPQSPFANPYRLGRDGSRVEVIAKYREHILMRPDLLAQLAELRGKRLGCWCATPMTPVLTTNDRPYRCHGQVIAELVDA